MDCVNGMLVLETVMGCWCWRLCGTGVLVLEIVCNQVLMFKVVCNKVLMLGAVC